MKKVETKKEEALKADESQIEEDSPVSEESNVEATEPIVEETIESPAQEAEAEELPTEPEGEAIEEEAEAPVEGEGRKTAQSRIRELVTEKKEAEHKAESLAEQVRRLTSYRPEPPYEAPQVQQDESGVISAEELMRRQDALVQIRLAQQENVHRVQQESLEAIKAYPELDPDSENFDPVLSEKVSKNVLKLISANPTESVKGFVDDYMQPIKSAAEKQASSQRETITKQVSEQAMRPTQVQEQERPFSELSTEEMEKKLGVLYRG